MADEDKKEKEKQLEYSEEFMKGLVSDVLAERLPEVLKEAMGDQANEIRKSFEDSLETMRKPVDKKDIGGEEGDEKKKEGFPTPFKNLGEQAIQIAQGTKMGNMHPGIVAIEKAATGLGESIDADGGFLLQPTFSNELIQLLHKQEELMSRARVIPLSGNSTSLKIPAIDETSRADGSRMGGVRGYWADEAGTKTASKPKFRRAELNLNKLIGLVYATDELLADASALNSVLQNGFAEELRFKINDAMVNGDGAGKPLGILNANALVTVAKETSQAAASVMAENVFKMWSRLWARSRPNMVWHVNQDVEPQLFGMSLAVGTGGVPVYLPAGGLSASPFSQLFGRPVIPIEQCASLGTVGDLIAADWSQYVMIDKGGMQSASSIHVRFVNDETAFRFVMRLDGQSIWHSALTPFKGTNTQSPFIALATRS